MNGKSEGSSGRLGLAEIEDEELDPHRRKDRRSQARADVESARWMKMLSVGLAPRHVAGPQTFVLPVP